MFSESEYVLISVCLTNVRPAAIKCQYKSLCSPYKSDYVNTITQENAATSHDPFDLFHLVARIDIWIDPVGLLPVLIHS